MLNLASLFAFILLGSAFASLWIKREPKIWGTLTCLALLFGVIAGHITWLGLGFLILLAFVWMLYIRWPNAALFTALICFGLSFKLRFIPGFSPFFITPKFAIGLENPLIGLFPLALIVPLSYSAQDWLNVLKGAVLGSIGIILLASLAILTGASHLDLKLPTFFFERTLSNLFLTSIPEEGFYPGFIQKTLQDYFKNSTLGNIFALLITALLFSISHIYWSPNLGILAFTFLTGLLYGGVYLYSKRIESAILVHFLFNLIHMTFFSYHAM